MRTKCLLVRMRCPSRSTKVPFSFERGLLLISMTSENYLTCAASKYDGVGTDYLVVDVFLDSI